jgi:signal transduction histidine kinase/CheY-like chemotaxis protein
VEPVLTEQDSCFAEGGECGALMRGLDWSATALGPSRAWPATLRTLVTTMLASRFAMRILWGHELILLYNDAYISVLGERKHPNAMGRPVEDSYRELWPTVGPMFARVMQGETLALEDSLLPLNRNGVLEDCYFTLSYSPIRDEAGAVRGVLGVVHETTQRHVAEERVAELLAQERRNAETLARATELERKRLYELFMQAPMPVSIFRGPEQILDLANQASLEAWGKTREIVGKPFLDAFPEMRGQGFDKLLADVLETRVEYRGNEIHTRLARGQPELDDVYWNFVYTPLFDGDVATGVLVCGFDVTEQVIARRRIERLAEELSTQKTALEAAHRLKDEFVATMSHELRTPLNAILGWTRLMKLGSVQPARVPHALAIVERNAVAQTELINDLLDVSRIITGKLRLNVESVDLPAVVREALETVRPAADARGIQLHAVIDSHAGPIKGDPDRLSQIFGNLLSNAVKFTPKGGRVRVHLEKANSMCRFTVQDNGAGIDAGFLPHVFDRFRQADQTITRRHGGLGLGLSIVKHLVELHGGTVEAQSAGPNQGATFTLTIPLAAIQTATDTVAHSGADANLKSLKGLRVLVVDDEADARELIAEILANAGVEVRTASNANMAMRELQSFVPHILVCDIGMPGEDGYSLIQRIRQLPPENGGRVRAAAVTAYARGEDRRRALAVGFNLHLAKPVDPSELVVSVARLAERYSS